MRRSPRGLALGIPIMTAIAVFSFRLFLAPEGRSPPTARLGDLRIAPNPLPPGEAELVIGSARGLPPALEIVPLGEALSVKSIEALSRNAIRITVTTSPEIAAAALSLRASGDAMDARLQVGRPQKPLALPMHLPPEALEARKVETQSDDFVYSFVPADGVELASVCVLNATTGQWFQRDLDAEASDDRAEPPRVDFLGTKLAPGANRLLIATFSRDGSSRLEEFVAVRRVPEGSGN